MVQDAKRHGDLVKMDATFGTKKCGWHMAVLCGVGIDFRTKILAVALISRGKHEDLVWILTQVGYVLGILPGVFVVGVAE